MTIEQLLYIGFIAVLLVTVVSCVVHAGAMTDEENREVDEIVRE